MSHPETSPDTLLRIAAQPSRDGLRLVLRSCLSDEVLFAKTALGLEGGPYSEKVCRAIRDTGIMPPSEVMSGRTREAGSSWPREVLELARWWDDFAPWQCFAAWAILTWVADPADDNVTTAGDETIYALASSAMRAGPEACASAIAFLRWHAEARNEPGPTVYHELAAACLHAALFRAQPGQRYRDALDAQCKRVLEVADREILEAIDKLEIGNINWPLDLTVSMFATEWRTLCASMLGPWDRRAMPDSASEILLRLQRGA
ncbi:MAG: hypothetical protein KIS87_01010 [Phycisphaeraceae bacterium]|nr:hypothetical protein [Phycisphaeraceae bacterium]